MSATALSRTPRVLRLFALLAAFALVVAACGDDDDTTAADTTAADGEAASGLLAELQEQGSITVGIANEVPYGYEDEDGNVTGEAPEVAKRVLHELGIDQVDAEVVEFGALINGLQAGQFDMIAAGMYINPQRAEQILFSDPDYCVGEAFAVPEGNPEGLTDFQSVVDNPDVTIAVLSGAVEEGYAETAGVPDDQIELFTDVNAQYDALEAGRVDAVTGTALTVRTQVENMEGFTATESFFPVDENGEEVLGCGGFGFRQENEAFRDAFNDALNELQEQGEIEPLITQFGFAPEDVQRAQDLTVEDLAGS
jgi:polar amino acid transport system substrate-binding protein